MLTCTPLSSFYISRKRLRSLDNLLQGGIYAGDVTEIVVLFYSPPSLLHRPPIPKPLCPFPFFFGSLSFLSLFDMPSFLAQGPSSSGKTQVRLLLLSHELSWSVNQPHNFSISCACPSWLTPALSRRCALPTSFKPLSVELPAVSTSHNLSK
jgi:hypothetical protein